MAIKSNYAFSRGIIVKLCEHCCQHCSDWTDCMAESEGDRESVATLSHCQKAISTLFFLFEDELSKAVKCQQDTVKMLQDTLFKVFKAETLNRPEHAEHIPNTAEQSAEQV